jgi:TonB family protein
MADHCPQATSLRIRVALQSTNYMRRSLLTLLLLLVLVASSRAQTSDHPTTLSVLDFGNTVMGKLAAEKLRTNFRSMREVRLLDPDFSRTAARGIGYSGSLNMSVMEARDLGAALDSDFYLIGDAQTVRRTSSQTPLYYESYSSIFIISSRTGRLVFWERPSFQADGPSAAEEQLSGFVSNQETAQRCLVAIRKAQRDESSQRVSALDSLAPLITEAPDDEVTAVARGLRLPKPYHRLRPAYPESAARAEAEAIVDVVVDVGADGEVNQIQVARWAGFGLDETTVATVRQMHFFPAMRDGTPIPMRVLLRYNFRKPSP